MSQGGERPHERAIVLIDEIGKVECFSSRFVAAVRSLLDDRKPVVATIAIKGGGLIAEAKARPDVEIWQVTKATREELPERLAVAPTARLGGQ